MSRAAPPPPDFPADSEGMDAYVDELIAATTAVPMPASPAPPADPELFAAECGRDFTFDGRRFLAKVVEVYDGDTIRVVFRFDGALTQHRARMAGYDSPEMKPPKNKPGRDAEIRAAHAAREALLHKLGDRIVFVECGPHDKYGRLLVTVFTRAGAGLADNGENVNRWMMAAGHGVAYDGGAKNTGTGDV